MKTLVTFPGRFGDIAWMLPTARAISEAIGEPVDLQIAGEFTSMVDLLLQQPYLRSVWADPRWGMSQGWEAPRLPEDHDRVIHLGYRRWPALPLPYETAQQGGLIDIDLEWPWITVEPWRLVPDPVVCGWSDCHFELKVGLLALLGERAALCDEDGNPWYSRNLAAPGSRWVTEARGAATSWLEAAQRIAAADLFLGDCSALHVLAVALGKPCVIVEPMAARHNSVFYPYGMDGPQVRVVKGLDGKPTWDSRHVSDALEVALHAR